MCPLWKSRFRITSPRVVPRGHVSATDQWSARLVHWQGNRAWLSWATLCNDTNEPWQIVKNPVYKWVTNTTHIHTYIHTTTYKMRLCCWTCLLLMKAPSFFIMLMQNGGLFLSPINHRKGKYANTEVDFNGGDFTKETKRYCQQLADDFAINGPTSLIESDLNCRAAWGSENSFMDRKRFPNEHFS